MARVEAPVYQEEKKSKWPARLTWGGAGLIALGVYAGAEVAALGVLTFGVGVFLWGKKKKG